MFKLVSLLFAVLVLNILSFGDYAHWPYAWLLPVVLLLLLQHDRRWPVWIIVWGLLSIGTIIAMRGMLPLPTPIAQIFLIFMSVTLLVPYWLHGRYAARIPGFSSTLVLPVVATSIEFISAAASPWGTWGSLANTQIDNPVVAQLASLTGLSGITFLIYWVAALIVYIWNNRQQRTNWFPVAITVVPLLVLVTGYGMARLAAPTAGANIRVGMVLAGNLSVMKQLIADQTGEHIRLSEKMSQTDPIMHTVSSAMAAFIEDPTSPRFANTRDALEAVSREAVGLANRAAAQGAQVISWYEGQFMVLEGDANRLIMEGQGFAYANKVMLLMPIAILTPGKITPGKRFIKNQVVAIGPQGNVLYTYNKAKPVTGVEPVVAGDGILPLLTFKGSTLSTVICYDADFPRLVRQTGMNKVDILFIPSGDWYDIRYAHMNMARFRAIENGVNIVRPASRGISAVIDTRGRVQASQNYFEVPEHVMVTKVTAQGTGSLYARIGDSFAWLTLLGLLLLIANYVRVSRALR